MNTIFCINGDGGPHRHSKKELETKDYFVILLNLVQPLQMPSYFSLYLNLYIDDCINFVYSLVVMRSDFSFQLFYCRLLLRILFLEQLYHNSGRIPVLYLLYFFTIMALFLLLPLLVGII